MPAHEAKIRLTEFGAEIETRIAYLRAAARGEGQSLSQRRAYALSGEWYVWFVKRPSRAMQSQCRWGRLWLIRGWSLSGLQSVLQAAVCDGSKFDAFAFYKDRFRSAEVDVGRCEVVDALIGGGSIGEGRIAFCSTSTT